MSKHKVMGKIFGIALVFVLLGMMLGGLPGIGNTPQAEGAATHQAGKASTVSAVGDGAWSETISITYDFPQPKIEETWEVPPVKGALPVTEGYVSVVMEGLPQWGEAGLPVLPFRAARILLPYRAKVQDITVTYGNKVTLPGSYLVEPGQEPVPLSHEGPVNLTPPNSEVYNSSAPFPGKLYSDTTVQSKTGYSILLVNLHPVEYIPKAGQLSYYENMAVKVTLGAAGEGERLSVQGLSQNEKVVGNMVDNPEIINSYAAAPVSSQQGSLSEPGDYEYVIITSEALEATPGPNNFQALRDNKISRGITATIVTTEWIYANYSGTRPDGGEDNQTRIRNFIIDAYNTWGTRYVLLGGDGDGADVGGESGDEIIPHRGFASTSSVIDYDIPADMYYACLEGTFDDNANGTYGEPNDGLGGGEVDLFAEVYVGRACVDSQTEVNNFVAKTLAYQNISKTDENLRKAWMVGEYLGFGGVAEWGGNYKDEIKEGSTAHGYTTVGFEDSPYADSFDVSTLYDRDYPGSDWPASEIINIINNNTHLINHLGHAYVGYVMRMYNADVDGLTNNELYFIGYSQGCYDGAFDGRTVFPGWYTDYDCICEHLTTEAHGAVAFIANSRYGWGASGSTDGPSQHYDREFWDAIFSEHIFNIGIANQDSKEDNAGRINNSPFDRYCYYEINLFGDPELQIKLYARVRYNSHQIDDSIGGDGDSYSEPGESINIPITLANTYTDTTLFDVNATLWTTDPYINITDDYEEYGNMSAGGTATCEGHSFDIAPDCPVNHTVKFNLNITASNGESWIDSFKITVVKRYTLAIAVIGNGTTTPPAGGHSCLPGTVAKLTAVPDANYTFVNWTGDVGTVDDVDSASTNITMDGDYSIVANFAINRYNLTISSAAGGNVTMPGESVLGPYNHGTVVNLITMPDASYTFAHWIGDVSTIANVISASTNITMLGSYSIIAKFMPVGAGATLQGHVAFPTRDTPPNNNWIEPFEVRFFQDGNEIAWLQINAITDASGYFYIPGIPCGTYNVSIKNWTCLSELQTGVGLIDNEVTYIDFGTTREGDANNDDWVTEVDLELLQAAYGTHQGDPDWNPHCDFNCDGVITVTDWSIMGDNWRQHGDLPISACLQGHVTFPTRGTLPNNNWKEPFEVRFFQDGNEMAWSQINVITDASGCFYIPDIPCGTYDVSIKNWICLSELQTGVGLIDNGVTSVDFGTTREGDSNDNDAVTGMDFSLLSGVFGSSPPSNPNCDFDRDNAVTGMDFSLLAGNFGLIGDLV